MANLGYIQVTRACNQACRFCSNPPIERRQTFERVAAELLDLAERHYDGVIFTGGEPTLAPFLDQALRQASRLGLEARIITNGQLLARPDVLERLLASGLDHVHVSVHSYRPQVQADLTQNPESLANITKALDNLGRAGVTTDINTVICAQNADHLHETISWLITEYPFLHHFVWNNLDPEMNRCRDNPDVIPRLSDFELSLHLAMERLQATKRSFRVERVPLCYMTEFAFASTETRKIVKGEERVVHFLDEQKGTVRQTQWRHTKAACCRQCRLDELCAGLYAPDYFPIEELYPVFTDPDSIREAIVGSRRARARRRDDTSDASTGSNSDQP